MKRLFLICFCVLLGLSFSDISYANVKYKSYYDTFTQVSFIYKTVRADYTYDYNFTVKQAVLRYISRSYDVTVIKDLGSGTYEYSVNNDSAEPAGSLVKALAYTLKRYKTVSGVLNGLCAFPRSRDVAKKTTFKYRVNKKPIVVSLNKQTRLPVKVRAGKKVFTDFKFSGHKCNGTCKQFTHLGGS